ncbi:Wzz/FepE/Etk N-terminal domain-containing protein (plasmid) [Lactiplantibacillus plantarum]|uniref:Wzz/FepE/Etk N-terminal domain-containing protein n=1 Tax=Lactiplantibacillus plantarum TaxID=1590 RepID=UPI00338E8D38
MESEQNISMMQIVGILRKHIKAIFGTTIVVTLAAIFVTFFVMTPINGDDVGDTDFVKISTLTNKKKKFCLF